MSGQTDPRLQAALPVVEKEASQFWQTAPRFFARETLRQKAIVPPKRKLRLHMSAPPPAKPEMQDREIVSIYGFTTYAATPEALHEIRVPFSIDGHNLLDESAAVAEFKRVVNGAGDSAKKALFEAFEKENLAGSAVDFGQLLLLFARSSVPQFDFALNNVGMIGANRALVIAYTQARGTASLHITSPGKRSRQALRGQLWVREGDYMPMRITLTSVRPEEKPETRDEAIVDYSRFSTALLPVSVVYREWVDNKLYSESRYEYSGWEKIEAK